MTPGASVYEIGSGAGYLTRFLAERGFDCVQTDLSDDRLQQTSQISKNLKRATTDGVHLTQFAAAGFYDYVISNQVVEHLHPDDLEMHFSEAKKLLKPGGEYILATPYAPFGPKDLSRVFGWDRPVYMHLHEMWHSLTSLVCRRPRVFEARTRCSRGQGKGSPGDNLEFRHR